MLVMLSTCKKCRCEQRISSLRRIRSHESAQPQLSASSTCAAVGRKKESQAETVSQSSQHGLLIKSQLLVYGDAQGQLQACSIQILSSQNLVPILSLQDKALESPLAASASGKPSHFGPPQRPSNQATKQAAPLIPIPALRNTPTEPASPALPIRPRCTHPLQNRKAASISPPISISLSFLTSSHSKLSLRP
jgi:hypothetical protein